MAKQRTGTVVRIWRAFGRVRFTVQWDAGERMTVTVPKGQIDATIRRGDTVGTIVSDPPYTAEDLLRWNTWDPAQGPIPLVADSGMGHDAPPSEWHYHRVGGPATR